MVFVKKTENMATNVIKFTLKKCKPVKFTANYAPYFFKKKMSLVKNCAQIYPLKVKSC